MSSCFRPEARLRFGERFGAMSMQYDEIEMSLLGFKVRGRGPLGINRLLIIVLSIIVLIGGRLWL